jgi:hypothetical protein
MVFAEDPRRVPQLPDRDVPQQVRKPAAMIFVRMRENKAGEIGFAIAPRQLGDQLVDDGNPAVVDFVGQCTIIQIDLYDFAIADYDGGGITATDRPEDERRSIELRKHMILRPFYAPSAPDGKFYPKRALMVLQKTTKCRVYFVANTIYCVAVLRVTNVL